MTDQQTINRHIIEQQAMDAHTGAYPLLPDDLFEPFRLLTNYLSTPEIQELRRQMDGGNLTFKRNVLLHWYDCAIARQKLLDLDKAVRDGRNNWRPRPLAERMDAVVKCQQLGMVVERESWTMDVLEVKIV
jgi:hypothetical protein